MFMVRGLHNASKVLVFSRKPLKKNGKINVVVPLAYCLKTVLMVYLIVTPVLNVLHLNVMYAEESVLFPLFINMLQVVQPITIIISLQVNKRKYELILNKLNEINNNFHCDKIPYGVRTYRICFVIWFLTLSVIYVLDIVLNTQNKGMMGLFYAVGRCTSVSIVHFNMISVSAISHSISEGIMGLNYAIPKKFAEDTVVEENRNEYLCGILKVTEDAYDDICGCCSRINEVFGFSMLTIISTAFLYNLSVVYIVSHYLTTLSVFLLLMNLLRLCVSFYSLVMVATGCESVHRTARELYRSLALFNSELQGDDVSVEVRVLARDVLHTVRARQPRLSACGLFVLRMNLVTGFLSLTATYTIVLLQLTHFL